MRKHITFTEDVEGVDCELMHEPCEWRDILKAKVGDKFVVAYLVQDNDCWDIDDMMGDCMGKLYSFHRHAPKDDHDKGLEALGNDADGNPNLDAVWEKHEDEAVNRYLTMIREDYTFKGVKECCGGDIRSWDEALEYLKQDTSGVSSWDRVEYDKVMQIILEQMWGEPEYFPGDRDAQLLACYEHGGQVWSLSGDGMQCRWDTSNRAGVFVPDTCLRDQLDSDEKNGKDRVAQARVYCKQFLESYNSIINGDVYGCVVETFDLEGEQVDEDACWGFVGSKYAEETLKSEYFDPTCKDVLAEYEKDVLTQGGRQGDLVLGDCQ